MATSFEIDAILDYVLDFIQREIKTTREDSILASFDTPTEVKSFNSA
jgi:hypothetical protein